MTPFVSLLPIRVVNELNDHRHWRTRLRRSQAQHSIVAAIIGRASIEGIAKLRVRMTRISPKTFDSDGTVASMKFIRDALAKCMGIDDGDKRVDWICDWEKGPPKHYSVRVIVESA